MDAAMIGPHPLSTFDDTDEEWGSGMAWAIRKHSKRAVNEAGRTIAADVTGINSFLAYMDALDLVNNWRASHSFPLNTFQNGLRRRGKAIDDKCLVAQRIKRISSITHKLQRFPTMTLSQMQDIGGCRIILSSVGHVKGLCRRYTESEIKHKLHHIDDYITVPKPSGYRGVHLIYRYYSDKKSTYNSLLIEMQIRSRLQHVWATAVETVGTFSGQALKSSLGADEWLRFFALMGTAISLRERAPPVPNTPVMNSELVSELRDHVARHDIMRRLGAYGATLRVLERDLANKHYFLVVLDPKTNQVRVTGFTAKESERAAEAYLEVEKDLQKQPGADAVLVSVDSVAALRRAYPNYFLDTRMFVDLLNQTLFGRRRLVAPGRHARPRADAV